MSVQDIVCLGAAYLLGAIPFGLLVARAMGGADLRQQGSGNIGATNAARVLGKKAGALTLAGDFLKGVMAAGVAARFGSSFDVTLGAAVAAVVGHIFPVYLGFRGGKGVATGFGVLMVLHWPIAIATLAVWLLGVKWSGISAVGALSAYGVLPLLAWFAGPGGWFFPVICGISLLILIRHADNIRRIMRGANG